MFYNKGRYYSFANCSPSKDLRRMLQRAEHSIASHSHVCEAQRLKRFWDIYAIAWYYLGDPETGMTKQELAWAEKARRILQKFWPKPFYCSGKPAVQDLCTKFHESED